MTEEIAKKVSELLELKSEYIKDLSRLSDPKNEFILGWSNIKYSYLAGISCLKISNDKIINNELKELLIIRIKEKISEVDKKILNLQC